MLTRGTRAGDVVWVPYATLSDFRYQPSLGCNKYVIVAPEHQLANLLADDGRVIKDSPSLLPENCYRNEREAMQAALNLFEELIRKCVVIAAAYQVDIGKTV